MHVKKLFYFSALGLVAILALASCKSKDKAMAEHPIIALFTDFGNRDAYVAQLKGAIKTVSPKADIVDLLHNAETFNPSIASYLLDKSSQYFPAGTIFVVVVDPGVGSDRKAIAVRTLADKTYIGPDNGIFTRVIKREGLKAAYEITNTKLFLNGEPSATFHGRDIFGPVAAHISVGTPLDEVGPKLTKLNLSAISEPTVLGTKVNAEIIHIDHYGNIITNIKADHLQDLKPGQLIRITIQGKTTSIPFVRTYADAPPNRIIALINSSKELEIAYPNKSAASMLEAKAGQSLTIQF